MFVTLCSKLRSARNSDKASPFRCRALTILNGVLLVWISLGIAGLANANSHPARPIQVTAALNLLAGSAPADGRSPATDGQLDERPNSSIPQIPAAPAQLAAPKIIYQDGQLTINAENSLLSDVLSELHATMGAEIDLPSEASGERVWVKVGPGPARKVLGELLNGTDLNFVIQGSATDAKGIGSVLLTMRSKAAGPGAPGSVMTAPPMGRLADRRNFRTNPAVTDTQEQENSASVAESAPTALAASTPSSNPSPSSDPSSSPDLTPPSAGTHSFLPQSQSVQAILQSTVDSSVAHPSPPASMSQEEVTQELQSMYKQRMQMQQNIQNLQQNR